jgi:hypothetical protein
MAKSAFESAGIIASIRSDSGGMRPHLGWSTGGFEVLVRHEDKMPHAKSFNYLAVRLDGAPNRFDIRRAQRTKRTSSRTSCTGVVTRLVGEYKRP